MARVLNTLVLLLFIGICLIYLSVRYWLWPTIPSHLPKIEQSLSKQLGQTVKIGELRTSWDRFMPSAQAQQVQIGNDLSVGEVRATLSWRSLAQREPVFASIRIDQPNIVIERLSPSQLKIAGFSFDLDAPDTEPKGLIWLLKQRRLEIYEGKVQWIDRLAELAPLSIEQVGFVNENVGRNHRVSLTGSVANTIILGRGDFTRPVNSRSVDFMSWRGPAFASVQNADWSALKQPITALLPEPVRQQLVGVDQAKLSARFWIDTSERPTGQLNVAVADLKAEIAQEAINIPSAKLSAAFSLAPSTLALSDLDFDLRDDAGLTLATNKAAQFQLKRIDQGFHSEGELDLKPLKLQQALRLVERLPLPETIRTQLIPIQKRGIKGDVNRLAVRWKGLGSKAPDLQLSSSLADLSVNPGRAHVDRLGVPGFTGLHAELEATLQSGALKFKSANRSSLTVPGLFELETLDFSRFEGSATWKLNEKEPLIEVKVPELVFVGPDAAGSLSGIYRTGGKGVGIVDIKGELTNGNAAMVHRYLPKSMAQSVRYWVRDAVKGGKIDSAEFVIKGDLWDFPFSHSSKGLGEFRINSKLRQVGLTYSPDWPALSELNGELNFDGPSMTINMQSGRVYGVRLSKVQANIEDFSKPELQITGQGFGPAQDLVAFVNASPITTRIDNFTSEMQVSGDAQLELKLELPLGDLQQTKVQGSVQFNQNDLIIDTSIPKFEQVSGKLSFGDSGFSLSDIKARFLGGPLSLKASPAGPGKIDIEAQGEMNDSALRALVNNAMTQKLSGTARYSANIKVDGRLSAFELKSDLIGLRSDLPAPFSKSAAQEALLIIQSEPQPIRAGETRSMSDLLNVKVGQDIGLAFERRRNPKTLGMEIHRGAIGVKIDPVLPDSGFAVALNTPKIDVDQWMPILTALAKGQADEASALSAVSTTPAPAGQGTENGKTLGQLTAGFAQGFSLLPSLVSVVADEVSSGGRKIRNLVLGASRVEGFWRANVSADGLSGYFTWRDAGPDQKIGVLSARFAELRIPKSSAADVEALLDSTPDQLPGLDLQADEFVFEDTNFGKATLLAKNIQKAGQTVWTIEKLEFSNANAQFIAKGQWAPRTGLSVAAGASPKVVRATDLDFELKISSSGRLLNQFGIKDAVSDAPGIMSGNIRWVGSPFSLDYPSLNGNLRVELEKGRFLKVDPGAAKLISVLNLQSLPKRLSLDFSDLVEQGFAFDSVNGNVLVEGGIAKTDSFEIRGAQARVKIKGQADIARESQDLRITVTPEVNAGLASLAYTAINPAIGLGTLLAQTVFRKPLQEAFAYELEVKGSWLDPKVEQKKKDPVQVPVPTGN